MLYSMTGFGEAVHDDERIRAGFRVRTVNNKGLDISLKLPFELVYLEPKMRELVKQRLRRGRVDIFSEIELRDEEAAPPAPINIVRMKQLLQVAQQMRTDFGVTGELDVATLIRLPDLTTTQRVGFQIPEAYEKLLFDVLGQALDAVEQTRQKEGDKLKTDLEERIQAASERVDALHEMTQKRQEELRDAIEKRVRLLLDDKDLDPSRLMQEVVYNADRLDISEEITRMRAHLGRFSQLIASDKRPLGKQLDFLVQELMRESTTIGNKAKNEWIAGHVVAFKTSFEKIREQLQNIE